MTRYRLPDVLGGGEFEPLTDFRSKAGNDWRVRFDIPDIGPVDIPREALTEMRDPLPPLPPEPPIGAIVELGFGVYQYRADAGIDWMHLRTGTWTTWSHMCEIIAKGERPFVIYLPDPLAEAPELPHSFTDETDGTLIAVGVDSEGVFLTGRDRNASNSICAYISNPKAMGLALLRAAAEQGAGN